MPFALNRRDALLGAAGVAAAGLVGTGRAQAATQALATPEERLKSYILMRGALDDRVVTGWAEARYVAMVDAVATPLFRVVSATLTRYRPAAGGGYEAIGAEFAFFVDNETGKVLDKFKNPLNGEICDIPVGGLPPSKLFITPDLHFKLGRDVPGLKMDHHVDPPVIRGNDLWFNELTMVEQPAPPGGLPFRYNEVLTMHAPLNAVTKKGALAVQSEVSFTIACSWRPWLKMGDAPGHMMAVGVGRMNGSPDSMPQVWIDGMKAKRPQALADPKAVLAPVWDAKP